jgi:hypothetical protein
MSLTRPLLLAGALLFSRDALADAPPSREQCSEAYVGGQHFLREGKLLDARRALLVCAREPCSASLWPECGGWLNDAERAMPSIVLGIHDSTGRDAKGVIVTVDGQPFANPERGTAVEIDPGPRVLHVEAAGYKPFEETVVIHEGEKSRLIGVTLEELHLAAPTVNPEKVTAPSRAPTYVVGGVGVAAAATFASFGIAGLVLRNDLASCKPNCSQSRVDTGNLEWTAADVSLGVSLVSLGVATYLYVHSRPRTGTALTKPNVVALPLRGGGLLGLRAEF